MPVPGAGPGPNLKKISKASVRRLARRGGVMRLDALSYEEALVSMHAFLEPIVCDAVSVQDSRAHAAGRKGRLVTEDDVKYAMKKNGVVVYG